MKYRIGTTLLAFTLFITYQSVARQLFDTSIKPAIAFPEEYVPLMKGQKVALVINQTSCYKDSLLLDMLLARGVNVIKILVPEHGFRGNADAGAHIDNAVDAATHLPVLSLYGKHKKPTKEDLDNVDIVVYDLQDVGVRFYTYISTMEYCMEACAEQKKKFLVLDRPNPNGHYVDGPVLEKENRSFVGMQPVPIVYGMTAGEYASMLKGEQWFNNAADLQLTVIKCSNYDHTKKYSLPIAPSPNLRNMGAVFAYPSLCLFEGTNISVGRGTAFPFQQFGSPELAVKYAYSFTPQSMQGAKNPPYEGKKCYGVLVGETPEEIYKQVHGRMNMNWLIDAYKAYPDKSKFFTDFFTKLAGTKELQKQITSGMSENTIRRSWNRDLTAFKAIRKKYLLYKDF